MKRFLAAVAAVFLSATAHAQSFPLDGERCTQANVCDSAAFDRIAASLYRSSLVRYGTVYSGTGTYTDMLGQQATYSVATSIDATGLFITQYTGVDGATATYVSKWVFFNATDFLVYVQLANGAVVLGGSGRCMLDTCAYSAGTTSEVLRFSGNELARSGSRTVAGGSVSWQEALATAQ